MPKAVKIITKYCLFCGIQLQTATESNSPKLHKMIREGSPICSSCLAAVLIQNRVQADKWVDWYKISVITAMSAADNHTGFLVNYISQEELKGILFGLR